MARIGCHSIKCLIRAAESPPPQLWRCFLSPRVVTSAVRAFSAAMSPPSKAIVYDHQGPPDSVTRSYFSGYNVQLVPNYNDKFQLVLPEFVVIH
ncbi:unnamed protein product [Cuscuta campestris]|uniref:Uncharacterized protein n=1 Tax=Cuscuta campestris TaxID=132261 RepID=A0A484NDB9_9ASTE|nr:unnamed protein product [Cuscuta campestris]